MCARTKVVIIDDDENAVDLLASMLADYPDLDVVGVAGNAKLGSELLTEHKPDILFLDIELPDKSGLAMLDEINLTDSNLYVVIFTAKYSSYEKEVFVRNEHDYLLKPINTQELDKIVKRFRHSLFSKRILATPQMPAVKVQNGEMLAITTITSEIRVIRTSEIGYFRYSTHRKIWEVALSDNSYLTLHKGTSANTILGYSHNFIQTHQSYIVNINSVMLIGQGNVVLFPPFNNDEVLLGRTYKRKLQDLFILI